MKFLPIGLGTLSLLYRYTLSLNIRKTVNIFSRRMSIASSIVSFEGKIVEILKMGDPRLLRIAEPIHTFNSDELHQLIRDMKATMKSVNGAGLAAPQIGVNLQLVIFGSESINPRYPDRPIIPPTVLINPVLTPIGVE